MKKTAWEIAEAFMLRLKPESECLDEYEYEEQFRRLEIEIIRYGLQLYQQGVKDVKIETNESL